MGEYARSLAIANGAAARWPGAGLHFMLSREAPYSASCPHPSTLLESSATFHSTAVIEQIERWRPDAVIFDNAGRSAQLRAARRCGARVVYVSSRPRQRRKAFRLRWMRVIDEHWIAYPQFIAGAPRRLERLKLALLGRPRMRYLDVILATARAMPAAAGAMPDDSPAAGPGPAAGGYVLLVPGGGTGHPGAVDAVEQFLGAARALAATGVDSLLVGRAPDRSSGTPHPPHLRLLGALPQAELAGLMRGARLIVANGGSTLLQSIACGKACIAVPIAGDQRERIRRCERAGVALAAAPAAAGIAAAAHALWQDAAALDALAGRATALGLADGVEMALRALEGLLATRAARS